MKKASSFDYMDPPNVTSMYLTPASNEKFVITVGQCKNKTSEDVNTLIVNVIKNINKSVITPFQHINNILFKTGTVP